MENSEEVFTSHNGQFAGVSQCSGCESFVQDALRQKRTARSETASCAAQLHHLQWLDLEKLRYFQTVASDRKLDLTGRVSPSGSPLKSAQYESGNFTEVIMLHSYFPREEQTGAGDIGLKDDAPETPLTPASLYTMENFSLSSLVHHDVVLTPETSFEYSNLEDEDGIDDDNENDGFNDDNVSIQSTREKVKPKKMKKMMRLFVSNLSPYSTPAYWAGRDVKELDEDLVNIKKMVNDKEEKLLQLQSLEKRDMSILLHIQLAIEAENYKRFEGKRNAPQTVYDRIAHWLSGPLSKSPTASSLL